MIQKDLEKLKENLIRMAALVESAIRDSVDSLVHRDDKLAHKVIEGDHTINAFDVKIDEECIRVLALTQPMAKDLRFITTAMKITTDLERIGDNAVNVAERALELNKEPILKPYIDVPKMKNISSGMVRDAIDAFVKEDKKLAMEVILRDDEVDNLTRAVCEELTFIVTQDPTAASRAMKITYVAKYIERMADHATNIAETVIYMIEGRVIRHIAPEKLES